MASLFFGYQAYIRSTPRSTSSCHQTVSARGQDSACDGAKKQHVHIRRAV